jgi:NAD(P)H-hydrate epimerase
MPLTRAAVREIDRRAAEEFGIPSIVLMENAGRGAAEVIYRLNPLRERVAIACGPGNNGGDGLVIARHLDRVGLPVVVWVFGSVADLSPDAAVNYRIVERMRLPLTVTQGAPPPDVFRGFGLVVDALFGTGLSRPLGAPFDAAVEAVNASGARVVAVDVPSGLDCNTGRPLGATVRAHHTVTFVGMKEGFAVADARPYVGEVYFADIGAPRRLVDEYLRAWYSWTP